MADNYFDQFDAEEEKPKEAGNYFDQFDEGKTVAAPPAAQPPETRSPYVGRGEFAPSAGAESAPLLSRETPEERAVGQATTEFLQKPLVPSEYTPPHLLAKAAEAVLPEGTARDIYTGEMKGVGDVMSSLTSPVNLALLPAAGARGVSRLAGALFGAQALRDVPEAYREVTSPELPVETRTRSGVRGLADILIGGLGLGHAAGVGVPGSRLQTALGPLFQEHEPISPTPLADAATKEAINAIEPSNAQVEAGKTPLGVETRPGSEVTRPSSSDLSLGEAQGEEARRQVPAQPTPGGGPEQLTGEPILEPPPQVTQLEKYPTVEVPINKIQLSKDVPNFKEGANAETGVVPGQELGGKYTRLGTGAVTLWERNNGDLEMISGRHRLDLAKRSGEETIPSQIVKESEGFTKEQAITFDAEANIRDGQGSVGDYANYFRNSKITPEEASSRGLLARDKGRKGYAIGAYASDDLYALYRDGKINEGKAAAIADTARSNPELQQVGLRAANEGAPINEVVARMEAARAGAETQPTASQGDFFSNTSLDETWKNQGKFVAEKRKQLQDIISTRRAVVNRYDAATATGSIKAQRDMAQAELTDAQAQLERWKNWASDPELRAQVTGEKPSPESSAAVEPKPAAIPAEAPAPKTVYHGTTGDFSDFDNARSRPMSLGAGAAQYIGQFFSESRANAESFPLHRHIRDTTAHVVSDPQYGFKIVNDKGEFLGAGAGLDSAEKLAQEIRTAPEHRVIEAQLNITNPKKYSTLQALRDDIERQFPHGSFDPKLAQRAASQFVEKLKAEGYDGVTFKEGSAREPTKNKARVWVPFDKGQILRTEARAPKLLPGETQGDLISSTQKEPFALAGEQIAPEEAKPTPEQPSAAYLAASEKANAATREFRQAQDQYRNYQISDDEFIAAKAKHDAAQAEFDKAFATEQIGKEQRDMFADFKEQTPSSPQSLGIVPRPSEFVRQDVAPLITGISKGFRQIRAALTPSNVSPIAGQTARIIREHAGQLARDREIAETALLDAAKAMRKNTPAQNLTVIDRLEKGQPLGNKALDDYKAIRQAAYDQRIKQVQNVNPNALQDLIENYFPHLWTRESIERLHGNIDNIPPDNPWARIIGKRPLAGPGSFLKQRSIPTTAEGIAIGLEPVTTNPVALDLLKMHEMDRYVMGHKIMQEMKENGLAKFVPASEQPEFGHVAIDDRIARVYGPRGWKIVDDEGQQMPGQKVLGAYYAPEDAARIINNYLSPGLRGNAVYDAFRFVGNAMNQVQLGISAYHAFFTAIDSATSTIALGLEEIARSGGSPAEIAKGVGQITKGFIETPVGSMIENLWRGNKFLREYSKPGTSNAELAKIVDAAVSGGARVKMDTFYNTGAVGSFFDALKSGNYTGAILRSPMALVQTVAKPLMEYAVPRMKLGIISQQLEYELGKLPKDATRDQIRTVAGRVVDSVDNRMGQLIYDNLFWNKTLKDGLMASVRSVGWNLGDIRELGGGALDSITAPKRAYEALTKGTPDAGNPVFTKRMAYTFALPLYVGVLGSVYQYLMTGKGPESVQDMFMPRTGRIKPDGTEERVMLPTYMKDVYPLALAAGREGVTGLISRSYRMAVNKLHPALSSIGQMIHNQDYYGNQILSPDDPLIKQHPTMGKIYREAQFIAKQFQPFSFRGVAQREGGLPQKLQAVAGIMPATRELTDTPAMRMIHDINAAKRPTGGYTMAQQQKREDRRKAETGQDLRPELFKRLSKDERERVLEVASPEERAIFTRGLPIEPRRRNQQSRETRR